MNELDLRNLLAAIVSASALLDHGHISEDERRALRSNIEATFDQADRLGIPYSVQNAAIFAGRKLDMGRESAQAKARQIIRENADRLTAEYREEWREYRLAHV